MNTIWNFSSSSQELLQKCLAAAGPPDENNKWVNEFKRDAIQITEVVKINDSPPINEMDVEASINEEQRNLTSSEVLLLEAIEENKSLEYDDITNRNLSKNCLIALAKKLPVPSVNAWLKHILSCPTKDDVFIENVLTIFFPVFLKRHYSRFCLDFLTEFSSVQPVYYSLVINLLLKDVNIPETVLHDFVAKLDEGGKTKFMNNMAGTDLSSEIFEHNLTTILIAYNSCTKSDTVQNFISQSLVQHAEFCKSNKHYGELLLQYLHNEVKMSRTIDTNVFSNIIEKHTSIYKRICMKTLNEITDK